MKKLLLGAVLCSLLLVPAFAGGGKDGSSSAKELVVYASVDEENTQKILEAFTADTGIKVQSVHLSSGPALARIQAEAGRPQADIWLGAPSDNHISAKDQGLTIAYKSAAYDHLDGIFKDPDGYWRCFYMNPLCFGVNTNALARAGAPMPTSWADLLKPEYKGIIQAPTPQSAGTAKVMVYALVEMMGEDAAFDYMAKLNRNIQTYTSSGTGPSKGVGVGDCAIGIQFTPAFFSFIEQDYPVEVVFPSEGVGFEAPAVSILKGVKNLEAAQIFVDWLVSKQGQDSLSDKNTFFYPVIPEAKLGPGMPPFSSLKVISYDTDYYAENTNRLVERWVNQVLTAR
ncbi:ABC transporter substrate-binding protein [Breznakiella homolactica]|uniref:ABC transporter substrate-binding protein n=1 Tax=Breznakiella homolactica TaxID=2798577 RepID=A0A7T8BCE2_9SPIR|nr:ABC transporter substrate-binding protein [Breznakiella homolactica]QQO11045.1 ABC transporter substrate-binding protein [Breznakiella homolactica]